MSTESGRHSKYAKDWPRPDRQAAASLRPAAELGRQECLPTTTAANLDSEGSFGRFLRKQRFLIDRSDRCTFGIEGAHEYWNRTPGRMSVETGESSWRSASGRNFSGSV